MENRHGIIFRRYKAGYEVWNETWNNGSGPAVVMKVARTPTGDYIGNPRTAYRLCKKRGIAPEKHTADSTVCSIGFSEREQKWYGWSPSALFGFGVGSSVKKGDCAYVPTDKEDFRLDCIRFWDDEGHDQTTAHETTEDGLSGVRTEWRYADSIPNKKLHGQISGVFTPYPEEFGRGEWTATSLADAKRMATAFAESVS